MTTSATESADAVALVTYSTRPRGGVVHTLNLAEALTRLGHGVHLFALGDPDVGFFREVDAPVTIIPAPPVAATLEDRVAASIAALTAGLSATLGDRHPLLHVQDCIAARAAVHLRDDGAPIQVVRTVHHVDDFTTAALVECQRRSILDPDHLLVVSDHWRQQLAAEFGVDAAIVTNGVDARHFAQFGDQDFAGRPTRPKQLRTQVGARSSTLFLTVGGIEPRKGSLELIEALALVRDQLHPPPVLVVVGGHSFQDHRAYREEVFARAEELQLGDVLQLVGTVSDAELRSWYHAADAFLFPSVKEGFGLVVLEALAAGLPVVATDIPVFREYLEDGVGALLVPASDVEGLASVMLRLAQDPQLRTSLSSAGPGVASKFTWEECARQHAELYDRLARARGAERPRSDAQGLGPG